MQDQNQRAIFATVQGFTSGSDFYQNFYLCYQPMINLNQQAAFHPPLKLTVLQQVLQSAPAETWAEVESDIAKDQLPVSSGEVYSDS